MAETQNLKLKTLIGFNSKVPHGLIAHPNGEHMIYPLGSTVIIRSVDAIGKKDNTDDEFLFGHTQDISCLILSPSGRYLATGTETEMGFTAEVIVWDFADRKELMRFTIHKTRVQGLAFSADEELLASIGDEDDNQMVVYDLADQKALAGHALVGNRTTCISFYNNDNCKIVTAGVERIGVWTLDRPGRVLVYQPVNLGQLKRHALDLIIHPDDTHCFISSHTGDVLKVSLETFLFLESAPPKVFPGGITCIERNSDGDIVFGTGGGRLGILRRGNLRVVKLTTLRSGITSIAMGANSPDLLVGTMDGTIYTAHPRTLENKIAMAAHAAPVKNIAFPKGFAGVFATCGEGCIRLWQTATRKELLRIEVPKVVCNCVEFTPDGHTIISGWSDGRIRAFGPQSGKLLYVIENAHNSVTALAPTHDCTRIVSGGANGDVRVWRIGSMSQSMLASMKGHKSAVNQVAIRADDSEALSASADGSCNTWSLTAHQRVQSFLAPTCFNSAVYHPDESQVLTTGSDRKLGWWDAVDGEIIRELEGSISGALNSLDIAPDGETFVSGGHDTLVKVWDYDLGVCTHIGQGHSGAVNRALLRPDGKGIVSIGEEGAIMMWEM
ncbi:WD domain G-beta repeat [Carpediemonas membranifera]|uniref:Cilia- and flagella-associated protein 52 n=1 Tax=Carpediemonas membranifera TaxID=201153 RepID=A0A8J6E0X1_9EUKA|nr:WD domain G-beta repeat [Carpediemonas membranifera]|eukprot:KAG9392381.1 WD domain G-beta repeat [Carpediemonas membranifera]